MGSGQFSTAPVSLLSLDSWHQGEVIQRPLLATSSAVQLLPRHIALAQRSRSDMEGGAAYSPISSYLITVPKLAFSSGEGKQKRGADVWPR